MERRFMIRIFLAGVASLVINALLFGVASVLTRERRSPLIEEMPLVVNVVSLPERERLPEPEMKEPPKPKPTPTARFIPEVSRFPIQTPRIDDIQITIDPSLYQLSGSIDGFVFDAADLDRAPRPIFNPQPICPHNARRREITGTVRVRFLVEASGTVAEAVILEATPRDWFEEAVLKAVNTWKYNPGTLAGRAVPAWVETTFKFEYD
jgi:periplasmic protein TonB